jgi:hypothetical protein
MKPIGINDYSLLSEKLAFINGYLDSIAILNTIPNNAMEHWMIDLGVMEVDLNTSIEKGINAPNWIFKATEISNWQKVLEDDCYYFFAEVLYEIQGSKAYYESDKKKVYELMRKYNLEGQLKCFIKTLADLLSFCQMKTAYQIEVDSRVDQYDPYFAHGEYNYAFELESGRILYLHFGAWD